MTAIELVKILLENPAANVYFTCEPLDDNALYDIQVVHVGASIQLEAEGLNKALNELWVAGGADDAANKAGL